MKSTKIKVLEHSITVDFEPPGTWANEGMGRCSLSECTIKVNGNMPHDGQCSIFLHELTHMIADIQGVELTEQSIDGISLGLLSFIRNNSKFITDNLFDQEVRTEVAVTCTDGTQQEAHEYIKGLLKKNSECTA